MAGVVRKKPVSRRAVVQRLKRRLVQDGLELHGDHHGRFYLVNLRKSELVGTDLELAALVRQYEILSAWETVAGD